MNILSNRYCVIKTLSVAFVCFLFSSQSFAHEDAILCDTMEDLIEQCGEEHDCITDTSISDRIGYCKAAAENISFVLCDRSTEETTCVEGEICKIGTIDPDIGVCAEVSIPAEDEEDDHSEHDHDDHDDHDHDAHEHDHDDRDHDHGCHQSTVGSSSYLFIFLILLSVIRKSGCTTIKR